MGSGDVDRRHPVIDYLWYDNKRVYRSTFIKLNASCKLCNDVISEKEDIIVSDT